MHAMCSGICNKCNNEYYQEIPINAGAFYPGTIEATSGKRCDLLPFTNWYLNGLENAFNRQSNLDVKIKTEKFRPLEKPKTVILNTIDATYGHALFELFNASYYLKQQDIDLIILVQENLRWLVPEGAAEVWTVSLSFSQAEGWHNSIAKQIGELTENIEQLYICKSFVYADSADYNIEDYTGVKPFPLEEWNERLQHKPVVTFIWRNDRFWKRVLPKWIDNRYSRKLMPKTINHLRKKKHHSWLIKFATALKKQIPKVDFAVSGMDNRDLPLPEWIKDFRYPTHVNKTAIEQCKRFAESHLVLGCNGSSLVLPSCHAGSVINIVPGDAWAVSAGSFAFRITSIGDTHFRYAMLPPEVSITRVVNTTISLLRDRPLIELHTNNPWRNHDADLDDYAWSNYRTEIFHLQNSFTVESGLVTVKRNDIS